MRTRTLCALFILVTCASEASPKDKIVREKMESGGRERIYYLFVPETLDASKPAPLLVTLHGSGRDGSSLIEPWKKLAAKEGIVLVGPDAADRQEWAVPVDGPDFLHELIEAIKTRFNIDPHRVYLFGHSAGGSFALLISLFEPEYFAAAAVHAGALADPQQFAHLLDEAKRRIPIAIWVGDLDPFFPVRLVTTTADFLKTNGFEVQFEVMRGHDHFYYGNADQINKAVWSFLQSRTLPGDPRWVTHKFAAH
jgi:poly(3-hydroxybutyrate) depolymerase